jgi:hypothetical protein
MVLQISRAVYVVLLAVLVSASSHAGAAQAQDATPSATSPAASPGNWHEVRGGAWAVPPYLLAEMAGMIQAEASRRQRLEKVRPMDAYTVQYQGRMKDGERSIRLAGACSILPGVTADDLKAHFYRMSDGGNCFFDAIYDPARHRFTSFSFHGYA